MNDSLAFDKLYRIREFKDYLKKSVEISATASLVAGNAFWLVSEGNFSMNESNTCWGLGITSVGLTMSILPCIRLTQAKDKMISCGFDKMNRNSLYRALSRAQALAVATTLTGITSFSIAVFGIAYRDEIVFGIGLGGIIASTILSVDVPILTQKTLDIYNENAAVNLKLGVTNHGFGVFYQFN